MSELLTLSTGESETVHGTFVAAKSYIGMSFGDAFAAWTALAASGSLTADDRKKQTLAAAVRYLNAQTWRTDADTFAKRDLIAAFAQAEYELAVLIASDASDASALDSGANIKSMGAGSAQISFFAPTSVALGTATKLPVAVHRLVGSYLAAAGVTVIGGYGNAGDSESPFSDCEDYDRGEPY